MSIYIKRITIIIICSTLRVQLMIEISVTGTNDHSPIFGETQYMATLAERNDITGVEVAVGAPVDTVLATDQDEPNTAAGMIEYRILTGNMLNGVTIFDIPDPIVS